MQPLVLPVGNVADEDFCRMHEMAELATSLEELIFYLVREHYRFDCMVFDDVDGDRLTFHVSKDYRSDGKQTVGFISYPVGEVLKSYKFRPFPEEIYHMADGEHMVPDLEWFEKRDKRLKYRLSDHDEAIYPASGLMEFLLSYCFSSLGAVIGKQELVSVNRVPVETLQLKLIFLKGNEPDSAGWNECVYINLRQLEQVLARRAAKAGRELLEYPPRQFVM